MKTYQKKVLTALALLVWPHALLRTPTARASGPPAQRAAAITLPEPSGRHAVGYRKTAVRDPNRAEQLTPDPADRRELVLELWYPADRNQTTAVRPYMDDAVARAWAEQHPFPPGFHKNVKTHSMLDAPLAGLDERFPVLVFTPGLSFPVQNYQALLEDLASHGYVIVGINHTYAQNMTVFPDGREAEWKLWDDDAVRTADQELHILAEHLPTWVADIRFVLDVLCAAKHPELSFLREKVRTDRFGVFGHSYGGIAAAYVLHADHRVAAALAMEGKIYDVSQRPMRVQKPFMFLVGGHSRALLGEFAPGGGEYFQVVIANALHVAFGDLLYIYQHYADDKWKARRSKDTPPDRVLEITKAHTRAFFDYFLLGRESTILSTVSGRYAEVELTRFSKGE